jgi:MYXO-CTERM domain-containing protein
VIISVVEAARVVGSPIRAVVSLVFVVAVALLLGFVRRRRRRNG